MPIGDMLGSAAVATEGIQRMRRFAKGDKVLAPSWLYRKLPVAEVIDVYEAENGTQVLDVAYLHCPETLVLCLAKNLIYIGDKKFVVVADTVYRVSNGEMVAQSNNYARVIAEFLETYAPPFPGEMQPVETHDEWDSLNKC